MDGPTCKAASLGRRLCRTHLMVSQDEDRSGDDERIAAAFGVKALMGNNVENVNILIQQCDLLS